MNNMEEFYKVLFNFEIPEGLAAREDHKQLQEIFNKLERGIEPSPNDTAFMDDYRERLETALTMVELSMGNHLTETEQTYIKTEPLQFPMLEHEIELDEEEEEIVEILATLKRKHSPEEKESRKKRREL